ncbi:hypothetical protein J3L11_14685 [Shewanella sp. 4t3-1-2LB]|nr:hypothetical protein [Shewanella sp. 4t3-1-2LB]MBO1272891.1 hypothetical protein [Shewanella sp. 4t3-1-2LB]
MSLPTMASIQPSVENETAAYSKEGIVIHAEVLRKSEPTVSAPNSVPNAAAIAENKATDAPKSSPAALTAHPTDEPREPSIITHNLFIYPDESFYDALNRWLKNEGYMTVAWSVDDASRDELSKHPKSLVSFAGTVRTVLPTLAKQIGTPLYFAESGTLAAIHQWHNRQVQITMVTGSSLRDAVKNLAADYGWNWNEGQQNRSWLATNDYPFLTHYPIVTPQGDLARALRVVLDGYPVSAQLLDSTQTLFIVDTK